MQGPTAEQTEQFQNVIIGFGKAGKTLAASLAKHGETVAVIEEDPLMYGGTCINVACLPTKNLIINGQKGLPYDQAFIKKNQLTSMLRNKNYHKVADLKEATVIDGQASFVDDHHLRVETTTGTREIFGQRIFINTGSTPKLPEIPHLNESKRVFTSRKLLDQSGLTKRLAILGAGPIGLEFAAMYASFGAEVTVFNHGASILAGEEPEIAQRALADLTEDGVQFIHQAELQAVEDLPEGLRVTGLAPENPFDITVDALLVATGRKPNTANLQLHQAGVKINPQTGAVLVNEFLQTNVPHIYALGDVNGGPQFTYISLDDFRIVEDHLFGDQTRSLKNRPIFTHTFFLHPAIARVGLTEKEAQLQGLDYKIFTMPASSVPKAQVIGDPRGFYKALVDPQTDLILGASIYAEESYETINVLTLAMQHKITATDLNNQIYTHPTMTEALNDWLSD